MAEALAELSFDFSPVSPAPFPAALAEPFAPSAPLDEHYHAGPRFVHAVDDAARAALTAAYAEAFADAAALALARGGRDAEPAALDLCASWASNYPPAPLLGRATGVGLCAAELERAGFDEWAALDACAAPLPLAAGAADVVTLAFGAEYLARPVAAFREAARVLARGGALLVAFSDRLAAPARATAAWAAWGERERVRAVAAWAREAGFARVDARDASPLRGVTDALVVVRCVKA